MELRQHFAKKLKDIREREGLTQAEFAKELGVSRGSISFYENMERVPDIDFLEKVSMRENCTADYLLGLSPYKNQEEKRGIDTQFQNLTEEIKKVPGYRSLIDILTDILQNMHKFDAQALHNSFFLMLLRIQMVMDDAIAIADDLTQESESGSKKLAYLLANFINQRELLYEDARVLWILLLMSFRPALENSELLEEKSLVDSILAGQQDLVKFAQQWIEQANA